MYQTIDRYGFMRAFEKAGRDEQFTRQGLEALFEYLEELEDSTGERMELDVIGLCCEFAEYDSAIEAAKEYRQDIEDEDEAIEWLQDQTIVIQHSTGIIIQSF
jgi:hypothetical protein